jgi:hypothetical protein
MISIQNKEKKRVWILRCVGISFFSTLNRIHYSVNASGATYVTPTMLRLIPFRERECRAICALLRD